MLKEQRKKQIRKRKNFFPLLLITIVLWILILLFIILVDPYVFSAIALFLTVLFFAFFLTFSIVFANSRRGIIAAFGFTVFLILRYFGIGNILNLLLILGVCLAFEIYFSSR
jgi:hypothetical protein